jgi:hypothetical protein
VILLKINFGRKSAIGARVIMELRNVKTMIAACGQLLMTKWPRRALEGRIEDSKVVILKMNGLLASNAFLERNGLKDDVNPAFA